MHSLPAWTIAHEPEADMTKADATASETLPYQAIGTVETLSRLRHKVPTIQRLPQFSGAGDRVGR